VKRSLLVAVLALAGSAALFAQYTQPGLYEDNNRRPVPGTGTLIEALTVLDKALGANNGVGYGDYVIVVKDGDSVPPITFVQFVAGTSISSYTSPYKFAHLSEDVLKNHLKIVGIPGPGGAIPTISLASQGSMFKMLEDAGVNISIENVTLSGRSGNNAPVVWMEDSNSFDMKANATISGNHNSNDSSAGGVHITGGTFTMSGANAAISDNIGYGAGAGVAVTGTAKVTFTMNGKDAKIIGNENAEGASGGGVYMDNMNSGTTFTMFGANAAISGNTTSSSGGGVYINNGTFIMEGNGTTISGNTTGGGGDTEGGGGVYVNTNGTFNMAGANAAISNNEAPTWGGGVYTKGTFNMTGANAAISNNKVVLYADPGTVLGCGGVYVDGSSSTFTMTSGMILNNTVPGIYESNKNNFWADNGGSAVWPSGTKASYSAAHGADAAESGGTIASTNANIWAEVVPQL
jgi:hypothetical protein